MRKARERIIEEKKTPLKQILDKALNILEAAQARWHYLKNGADCDPYRNPWTQNIIDSSRRIKKPESFAQQPLWDSRIPHLPLEILFEILDLLDCKEIATLRNLLRIEIPDCYWRLRAAWNLIEIDEIAGEDLNWQYLCSKIEAVGATNEKFEARRYILNILRNKIKPTYLKNLEKRDFPRLEEVIEECQDKIERESHKEQVRLGFA